MGAILLLAAGTWLFIWLNAARWLERRSKRRGIFSLVVVIGCLIPFMDLMPLTIAGWLQLRQLPNITLAVPLSVSGVRTDGAFKASYVSFVTDDQVLEFIETEFVDYAPVLFGVPVGPPGYYQFWRPQDPTFCPDTAGAGSNGHFRMAGECFRLTHSNQPLARLWLRTTVEPLLGWPSGSHAQTQCVRLTDLESGVDVARRCWCRVSGWMAAGGTGPSLRIGDPLLDAGRSFFSRSHLPSPP